MRVKMDTGLQNVKTCVMMAVKEGAVRKQVSVCLAATNIIGERHVMKDVQVPAKMKSAIQEMVLVNVKMVGGVTTVPRNASVIYTGVSTASIVTIIVRTESLDLVVRRTAMPIVINVILIQVLAGGVPGISRTL